MRLVAFAVSLMILCCAGYAADLTDASGVVRVFGDASSWMSACFVVGDGSWVVTTADTITEKAGPETQRTIRFPMFISYYTGRAYQCDLKAFDKDLNVALLKLPVKGLPAAPLAPLTAFKKAAYGTLGQLVSGEPIGNRWPTEIYGITRDKKDDKHQLIIVESVSYTHLTLPTN